MVAPQGSIKAYLSSASGVDFFFNSFSIHMLTGTLKKRETVTTYRSHIPCWSVEELKAYTRRSPQDNKPR